MMHTTRHATHHAVHASPVGRLLLVGRPGVLTGLYVDDHDGAPVPDPGSVEAFGAFSDVVGQLDAYFAGDLRTFDVPVELHGTDFQRAVWHALLDVPYGGTASYGDIARAIRRPKAVRAVGAANGANPVSIIVPCHRVIGSDGTLTGYGWGTERKAWLLEHERAAAGTTLFGPADAGRRRGR